VDGSNPAKTNTGVSLEPGQESVAIPFGRETRKKSRRRKVGHQWEPEPQKKKKGSVPKKV